MIVRQVNPMWKTILIRLLLVTFVISSLVVGYRSQLVQASVSTNEQDAMTRQKISVTSQHILSFTMAAGTSFAASETMIFTWPSGFTFPTNATWVTGDFAFNDGTARTITSVGASPTCTAGVNNVSVTADQTNRKLTVTACSTYTTSSTGAGVTFTVNAGTGSITNPSSASSASTQYEIAVSGTYGDSAFGIDVPILDDDQVSVTASVDTFINFDLDIGDGAHSNTNTPYSIDLGELTYGAVTTDATSGISEIYIDLDTNADNGAVVQVKSANGALSSSESGDTIPSLSTTLTTNMTDGGYGLASVQQASATEGTLTPASPFNVFATANGIGALTTSFQTIFNTGTAPIVAGDGKVAVRAVAGKSTQAAADYADTLTFRATATY